MGGAQRMINSEPTVSVLPSGLKLVHIPAIFSQSAIFGIMVKAGSASETQADFGLAHFVEHTIFKGTSRRKASYIINRMEAVGGELNAFTTKEETSVYSIFPSGYTARAIALIAELISESVFPDSELEKERDVVIEEINSYLDTPIDAAYDTFEDIIFQGTPLGHNILGTKESVKNLTSAHCRAFLDKFYVANNMVAFYSGPETADKICRLLEKNFASLPVGEANDSIIPSSTKEYGKTVEHAEIHQAHAVYGIRTANMFSQDRYAVSLFTNIIGGPGMNSLLNVGLRERRGLVYTVEATSAFFSSQGLITIYYGCDADEYIHCINCIKQLMERLAGSKSPLTDRRLEAAKRQYLGQTAIASENRENRIMAAAKATLFRGTPTTGAQFIDAINAVTPQQIKDIAQDFTNGNFFAYVPM